MAMFYVIEGSHSIGKPIRLLNFERFHQILCWNSALFFSMHKFQYDKLWQNFYHVLE